MQDNLGAADLMRLHLVAEVNHRLRQFVQMDNGLALWQAYALCRERGEPVPEVILKVFDQFAEKLALADKPKEIAAALRMHGRGTVGSARRQLNLADKRTRTIERVHALVSIHGRGLNDACKRVAGAKWTAAKKTYQRWAATSAKAKPSARRPAASVFEWGQSS